MCNSLPHLGHTGVVGRLRRLVRRWRSTPGAGCQAAPCFARVEYGQFQQGLSGIFTDIFLVGSVAAGCVPGSPKNISRGYGVAEFNVVHSCVGAKLLDPLGDTPVVDWVSGFCGDEILSIIVCLEFSVSQVAGEGLCDIIG